MCIYTPAKWHCRTKEPSSTGRGSHYNVPQSFWADRVLTANYLINRMPSFVLKGKTPFSILKLPKGTNFPLTPNIFGCISYVHDHRPGHNKLATCAIKCVFLGYSRVQKGYHCYSPTLRRYFTCDNVTFNESSSFFVKPTNNALEPANHVPDPFESSDTPVL
ncbi:hypothetical protein L6452_13765 [Arctium lappa]|uniref:Uncharacterized protein n=1 Tax=Arctium lappa TaxID=4217 RepID=A0ACB9CJ72_ARCLA|nr:hypothetical protein L6452_13765 [Arctium lappa]